jgi:hypothetical protein
MDTTGHELGGGGDSERRADHHTAESAWRRLLGEQAEWTARQSKDSTIIIFCAGPHAEPTADASVLAANGWRTVVSNSSAALFRREGRYWVLAYEGVRTCVPDSKGLRVLAILLADPNREFCARGLVHLVESPRPERSALAIDRNEAHIVDSEPGLDPLLDEQAKRTYRDHIASLREQIDEAMACNDPCRAGQLRERLDMIVRQLAAAVGLNGKDRPVGDNNERARQNVRKNIKSALVAIHAVHPALGRYLDRHVKTGRYCSYQPDPDRPVAWVL